MAEWKAQITNAKTEKSDFINIKICDSKNTIKRVKRYPQHERKYLQLIYLVEISTQNM